MVYYTYQNNKEGLKLENNDDNKYRYIPMNAIKKGRILKIPWKRWVEAVGFITITGILIWSSPFVPKIKTISIVVICTAIFAICIRGIKNRSITEIIRDIVTDNRTRKKYRLGSVTDERRKNYSEATFGNESLFERSIKTIKRCIREFDQKYDR